MYLLRLKTLSSHVKIAQDISTYLEFVDIFNRNYNLENFQLLQKENKFSRTHTHTHKFRFIFI